MLNAFGLVAVTYYIIHNTKESKSVYNTSIRDYKIHHNIIL